MKIALIADGHPREWPILKILNQHFPSTTWIQPLYGKQNGTMGKISSVFKQLPDLYYRLRSKAYRMITKQKVDSATLDFSRRIQLPWQTLENEKGFNLLEDLQPDIIITCRAPILPPEILAKAEWGGINVHFGLVPEYRGNHGLFWALANDDFDALGGSIHLLDEGIDTGGKLVDAYPKLQSGESLISVEVEVSRILAEALVSCLQKIAEIETVPQGYSQQSEGRNYLADERTLAKDLSYLRRRSFNSIPAQEKQIQFFF